MRLVIALIILLATLASNAATADSAFTDEQLQEIQKLLEAERAEIKREVIVDLCKENPDICDRINPQAATLKPAISPLPIPAGDTESTVEAPVAIEPLSTFRAMMGPMEKAAPDHSQATDGARFDVVASTADSRASIEFGRTLSIVENKATNKGEFTNLSFAFSAPLNKDKGEDTTVATLDGLSNAFQATLRYSKFNVHGLRKGHLVKIGDRVDYTPEYIELCKAAGIDLSNKDNQCDANLVKEGLKKNGRSALYGNYIEMFFDPAAWKSTYGFEGTVGYEEFKFRETATLDKKDSSELPWSIGVFGGVIPPSNNAFISFGLKFQSTYKAADKLTICPTETEFDYLECVTESIDGPKETKKHLAYVDIRTQLKKLGYSVRLTHDFKNDETGVDLPIYFLQNAKGNFNGGLRVGWTSEDDFIFGVFVGSDFTLLR